MPTRFLWWWRASRVVQDYDLAGSWREVIDEFPFFSFLLADLHPHVLAIPFALLAIALALNMFSGGAKGQTQVYRYRLDINPQSFAFGAIVLGGLAFLNTWDFPIYVSLFSGAYVLHRRRERRLVELTGHITPIGSWSLAGDFLVMALSLGVTGVLLYLPFYLGFSSQAGGVIPNLIYVTRGTHLWVMFGIFFVPLFGFLLYIWRKEGDRHDLGRGLMLAITLVSAMFFLVLFMSVAIINIPAVRDLFLGSLGAVGRESELFGQAIVRRLTSPGGWITLIALLALGLGLIWPKEGKSADSIPDSHKFALLLILTGALLVIGPEFFYLRDQFGYRINTIFKFYYQAWILFGVAAAYGTVVLLRQLRGIWGRLFEASIVVLLAAALIYPALSLWTKTDGFNPAYGWTLDGTAYLARQSQDEVEALRWLEAAPSGVVVEAVGGSYSEYARVATHSGKPTVLGWPGHESQWRGGAEEMGSRQGDIERLYRSNDWTETQEILRQYDVRYIYVGPLERSTYGVNENKFERFLQPVFKQGQVTIYEVPRVASSS
jgi:YYY domain-containing protein